MCRTQFVLVFVTLYVGMAQSWDTAMSTGDDLLRFYTNESLTSTIKLESRNLTVLVFDEVHNIMLYIDKQINNDTICGYDLTSIENKCFTQGSGRNIHGLAFDPVTELVFFTDTNERSVNWVSLKPGSKNNVNGNLLIKMDDGIPRDIIVDSCRGYIYWLNSNLSKPTIERARLNGTERQVFETLSSIPLNSTYKYEPHSLAIDQQTHAIYWMEPVSTTEYRLFLSELNRKYKKFVLLYGPLPSRPTFTNPSNTLSFSKDFVVLVVFGQTEVEKIAKTFDNFRPMAYSKKNIISVIANYKIKDQVQGVQDCKALSLVKIGTEHEGPFCVHGTKDNEQSVCKCTPGYTGVTCDTSVCENYCLNGNCSFNDVGLPECRCNAGYTGKRCEVSVCENYCFQGNCSFNDKGIPECSCSAGYTGGRCEVIACYGFCLNNGDCSLNEEDEPSCQCVGSYGGYRCEVDTRTDYRSSTVCPPTQSAG